MAIQNNQIDRRSLQGCGGFPSAEYHLVGLIGGKDLSAFLLLGKWMLIDSVILADTGMVFPKISERRQPYGL